MRTQTLTEKEERNEEIDNDYMKARNYPDTIIGRKRLRGMRRFLWALSINMNVPNNSAAVTAKYCKEHGKNEHCELF